MEGQILHDTEEVVPAHYDVRQPEVNNALLKAATQESHSQVLLRAPTTVVSQDATEQQSSRSISHSPSNSVEPPGDPKIGPWRKKFLLSLGKSWSGNLTIFAV